MWQKTIIMTFFITLLATASLAFDKQDYITSLISNTQYCHDDCRMTLEVCNPETTTLSTSTFSLNTDNLASQLGTTKESITWFNHTWTERRPIYETTTQSYTCKEQAVDHKTWFECYANELSVNGTAELLFSHEYENLDAKTGSFTWTEQTITGYDENTYSEVIGETSKVKNLKVTKPIILPGHCGNIVITGSMKYLNDAVDLIPLFKGYEYPEYAVWNSSLYNYIATPNMTGTAVNNTEAILWLKVSNCTDGTRWVWNSTANNASCRKNLCTTEMGCAEDCSDVEFYNADTNETLVWVAIPNATGVSYYINNSNDTLHWDAARIINFSMNGTNSTNIRASCNGANTTSKMNDANPDMVGLWAFEPSFIASGQLLDWSGLGNTLTATGTVFIQNSSCSHGNGQTSLGCYFFDGTGDRLNAGNSSKYKGYYVTETWWMKVSGGNGGMPISNYPLSGDGGYRQGGHYVSFTSPKSWSIHFGNASGAGYQYYYTGASGTLTNNTWYHIALVYNSSAASGSKFKLYINGVLQSVSSIGDTDSETGMLLNTDEILYFGALNPIYSANSFTGFLDDYKIYNYSMTDSQVAGLYAEPAHVGELYWSYGLIITAYLTVNAVAPPNNTVTGDNTPSFTFNISTNQGLANCSLIVGGNIIGINTSVSDGVNTVITSSVLADGTYQWRVECTAGNLTNSSSTPSLQPWITIDTTPPELDITSPANNSVFSSPNVTFTWTLTDLLGAFNYSCNITADGSMVYVNTSVLNGSSTVYLLFGLGLHNFSMACNDSLNHTNNSGVYYFSIECGLNFTGLCNGCRYQDLNVSGVAVVCDGFSVTDLEYVINDFLPESADASGFDLLLERGWNRLSFFYTANGTSQNETYNVWGKSYDEGEWSDMSTVIVPGIAAALVVVVGLLSGFFAFFILAGFITVIIAYELLAYSVVVAVFALLAAIGLLVKGAWIR